MIENEKNMKRPMHEYMAAIVDGLYADGQIISEYPEYLLMMRGINAKNMTREKIDLINNVVFHFGLTEHIRDIDESNGEFYTTRQIKLSIDGFRIMSKYGSFQKYRKSLEYKTKSFYSLWIKPMFRFLDFVWDKKYLRIVFFAVFGLSLWGNILIAYQKITQKYIPTTPLHLIDSVHYQPTQNTTLNKKP